MKIYYPEIDKFDTDAQEWITALTCNGCATKVEKATEIRGVSTSFYLCDACAEQVKEALDDQFYTWEL